MNSTQVALVLTLLGVIKTFVAWSREIVEKVDELAAFIKARAGIDPTPEEMAAAISGSAEAHAALQAFTFDEEV